MKPHSRALPPSTPSPTEARCHCGQLMAIMRKDGVELKCKRCKRITLIPFSSMSTEPTPTEVSHVHVDEARHTRWLDVHVQS
ncbi:MAG: hypothetical protein AB7T38_14885 [Nitrospirales bacterium]